MGRNAAFAFHVIFHSRIISHYSVISLLQCIEQLFMHGQLSQSYVLYIIDMYTYMVCFLILHRLTSKLVVRERNLDHNHRIGPDVAAHYSADRKLSKV